MCWSFFVKQKSELKNQVVPFIKKINKKFSVQFKVIRCDNAGENKSLQEAIDLDNELHNIVFEYTAPYTPQQAGVVERKFATLWNKVCSMLNGAGLPSYIRDGLWAECANHATKLNNILIRPGEKDNLAMRKG